MGEKFFKRFIRPGWNSFFGNNEKIATPNPMVLSNSNFAESF